MTVWQTEQQTGAKAYYSGLEKTLDWAIRFFQVEDDIQVLQKELQHIFQALMHARNYPPLHLRIVRTIHALGRLPHQYGNYTEWENHLRFGIHICETHHLQDDLVFLLNHLSDILFIRGDMQAVIDTDKEIYRLCSAGQVRFLRLISIVRSIKTLSYQQKPDDALEMLEYLKEERLEGIPAELLPAARAYICLAEGVLYRYRDTSRAYQSLTDGLDLLTPEQSHTIWLKGELFRMRGLTAWIAGRYSASITDLKQSKKLYQQVNDGFSIGTGLGNLGLVYWSMGQLNRAERKMKQSIQMVRHMDANLRDISQRINLGLVYIHKGWSAEAIPIFSRQIKKAHHLGIELESIRARSNRGMALYHTGEYKAAIRDLEYHIHRKHHASTLVNLHANLSRCYQAIGQPEEAQNQARKALDFAQNESPLRLMALRSAAEIETDPEKAAILFREALQLAKACQRGLDESGCLLMLAALENNPTLWNEGVAILHECDAQDWLTGKCITDPPRIAIMG